MKNIHVLPTDKPSRLHNTFNILRLEKGFELSPRNKNIYITNDEEIKDGDYYLYLKDNSVQQFIKKHHTKLVALDIQKKIILTTDQDLIKDGVQAIPDEFLEWFVKNPSCEEVEVDYGFFTPFGRKVDPMGILQNHSKCVWKHKIIIPKEEPKQETLEEACVQCCGTGEIQKSTNRKQSNFECDVCSGKGYWNKVIEPKQEPTLEEAAENSFLANKLKNSTAVEKAYYIAGFRESAKWMQERSYSEEELKSAFKVGFSIGYGSPVNGLDSKEETCDVWFEQSKKK